MVLPIGLRAFRLLFLPLLFTCSLAQAQQVRRVLTLNNVLDIVRKYHPVARQANLFIENAQAEQLAARGAFDPSFYVYNEQKTFDGKNYYFYTNPELKIPTWYGVTLKAGLESNGGERLINEATAGRSSYAGISFPLLQNLALDSRRAVLEQARIFIRQSEADRRNVYNNLLFDAAEAYWEWVREYQVFQVVSSAVNINEQRLRLVRSSFLGGDRAAIDTIEALTQLQNFQLLQSEALYRWQATALNLSNFLWLNDRETFTPTTAIVPDSAWNVVDVQLYPLPIVQDVVARAMAAHPKLQSLDAKLDVLEVERRLRWQSLLPTLNINYNFLNKGYEPWKGIGQNLLQNNYKYGIEVGMPLLLRQARGNYKIAGIKIRNTTLEQDQTRVEIENKVQDYYNQVLTLRQQVKLFEDALENYIRLLRAEEVKFSIGESSLFLLNTRENKVLETTQKLVELKTKFFKAQVALQWAGGVLE